MWSSTAGARGHRRGELRGIGIDEEPHLDTRVRQRRDGRLNASELARDVESALGGELLAALRHEAGVGGADPPCERDHRLGRGHLEVQLHAEAAAEHLHVALLDVAPVLAQVDRDTVGPGRLGDQRRLHRIRVVDAPGLPERRDVVDVDA